MSGMIPAPSGTTRLYVIVGDPIAQVRSPAGVSAEFAARGHDGILVPVQVATADLAEFLAVASRLKNLDGIVVTIPHKFACYQACASATKRAHFLRTVNLMRRRSDGSWHGDMVDGLGFLAPRGRRGSIPGESGRFSSVPAGQARPLRLLWSRPASVSSRFTTAQPSGGMRSSSSSTGSAKYLCGQAPSTPQVSTSSPMPRPPA